MNRILVNLVIDRSRAVRDELTITDVENRWHDDDYTVDPEQVLARAELRDELEDALVRLPAGYRTVVVLHDAVGWPVPTIADALRIGLPAAKQRLRRGRMMLVSTLAGGKPKRAATLNQPVAGWHARRQVPADLDEDRAPATRAPVESHLASVAPVRRCTPMSAISAPRTVVPNGIATQVAGRRSQVRSKARR